MATYALPPTRLRLLALSIAVLCPAPTQAQSPAQRAVDTLLAHLDLAPALLAEIRGAVISELGPDLTYDPASRTYTVSSCEDTEMGAELADLNGDDTPEVHVWGGGTCMGGRAGNQNWVFIRATPSSGWRANLTFGGGLQTLASRAQGFADVSVAGPGFCRGLWRWNGRQYDHLCNVVEGSGDCHTPCPRSLDARIAGERLPLFAPSDAVRPPVLLSPSAEPARRVSGSLDEGDPMLSSGAHYDEYAFEAEAGDRIEIDLTDEGFYSFIEVKAPSGLTESVSDFDRDTWSSSDHARLRLQATEAGTWRLFVTSQWGEPGAYELEVRVAGDVLSPAEPPGSTSPSGTAPRAPAPEPAPAVLALPLRHEAGRLERGDATISSGEYYDEYPIAVEAGDWIAVNLTSSAFDPYLVLKAPSGASQENDDHEGSRSHSYLRVRAAERGTWRVFVTSFRPGESGDYELEVQLERGDR